MNAQPKITRVSWPVQGADGSTYKRRAVVRPWEVPPEDALDPVTGEPKHWEPQHVRVYIRAAMDILKRLPMHRGGMPAGERSGMPDIVREVMESYGWDEARAVVRPSAEEISDPRPGAGVAVVAAGSAGRADRDGGGDGDELACDWAYDWAGSPACEASGNRCA